MKVKRNPIIDFDKRLYQVMLDKNITITELSIKTNTSRPLIYSYIYDGIMPSSVVLARLCLALRVSADYLLFGKKGDR